VRGEAGLVLDGNGSATRIAHLHQQDPLRILFPHRPRGDLFAGVLVTTSGGLVAGDELDIDIRAEPGAAGLLMPQAAEKIYRSDAADCRISVRLSAGADSWLEWLPQETILFQGARLRRRMSVELDRRARLLAGEITVFGRRAMGEIYSRGFLREDWDIRQGGRAAWADAFLLEGPVRAVIDHPAGLGGAEAMATAVYAGPDSSKWLATARKLLDELDGDGVRRGVSLVGGILVVRWLGDAFELRRAYGAFWAAFRHATAGLPAALPRLWHM
jgi:urease accessory protein